MCGKAYSPAPFAFPATTGGTRRSASVIYLLTEENSILFGMWRLGIGVLLWLCTTLVVADATGERKKVSVAVVGAGIGGATASHFLREALDEDFQAKIVVFEGAMAAGGRTDVSRLLNTRNGLAPVSWTSAASFLRRLRSRAAEKQTCSGSCTPPSTTRKICIEHTLFGGVRGRSWRRRREGVRLLVPVVHNVWLASRLRPVISCRAHLPGYPR